MDKGEEGCPGPTRGGSGGYSFCSFAHQSVTLHTCDVDIEGHC